MQAEELARLGWGASCPVLAGWRRQVEQFYLVLASSRHRDLARAYLQLTSRHRDPVKSYLQLTSRHRDPARAYLQLQGAGA